MLAADCLAAYAADGAASLSASYSNLNNPGTNDLPGTGTPPAWDAVNGWKFDGVGDYLVTAILPGAQSSTSVIAKYSNWDGLTDGALFGALSTDELGHVINVTTTTKSFQNDTEVPLDIANTDVAGTLAFAGNKAYIDGVAQVGTITDDSGAHDFPYFIGAFNLDVYTAGAASFLPVYIQKIAFYSTTLSAAQVAAIAAAM